MAKNLQEYGEGCVYEAAFDMIGKPLDFDALSERARDAVGTDAENACTYHSDCMDIIRRYEYDFGSDAEELCDGGTFKATEWEKAMESYANAVAYVAVGKFCQDSLDDLRAKVDEINAAAEARGADIDAGPVVTGDCPHGWAPHESETPEGVHYWAPAQLEGCHAVAVKSDSGLWLSYTWTAGAVAAE